MIRSLTNILLLILSLSVYTAKAQYSSINVDAKTQSMMSSAYEQQIQTEKMYNDNLSEISKRYSAAALASAGIFSAKYLERKALTNLNLLDDRNENYYYTRIYNLVKNRIIPKIIVCAKMMVKDPSTAFYWGSYILRITEDVESLCQQFENVVTNGRLSFADIGFLEIADDLKDIFDITKLGGIDWKIMFEKLGADIEGSFSKESIKISIETLIKKGAGLAQAGYKSNMEDLLRGTTDGGTLEDQIGTIINLVENIGDKYDEYKDLSYEQVAERFVGKENIEGMFNLSDYDVTKWIDDFESAGEGEYYTQRVYIYRKDAGEEKLCSYTPPTDNYSISSTSEWYRISTNKPNYAPSSSEKNAIMSNSERYSGWSPSKINQLNETQKTYKYAGTFNLMGITLSNSQGVYSRAFAYQTEVTRSWNNTEEVYEEVFDSYSMDWNTFIAQMKARAEQYNMNNSHTNASSVEELNDGVSSKSGQYLIGYDERKYYTTTDAAKIKGVYQATISMNCHDSNILGEGSNIYKCDDCGSSINAHTKQCSMKTKFEESSNDSSLKELKKKESELSQKCLSLQEEIDYLYKESEHYIKLINSAPSVEESEYYISEYRAIIALRKSKEAELSEVSAELHDVRAAIKEVKDDRKDYENDYQRIPYYMNLLKSIYNITWTDSGTWSGYTFIRKGTMYDMKTEVTFKATISMYSKPKYIWGIKIHRAKIEIKWSLTSNSSSSSVLEVIQLDKQKKPEENARIVNDKISDYAKQYPGCDISVEYEKNESEDVEDKSGVRHLLWASDRLEIARGVEARLTKIYADLVVIHKFLHYKYSIGDWVKLFIPKLNADKNRKLSIAEQSRRRWLRSAGLREEEKDSIPR